MSKPVMLIVDDIEMNREPLAVCFSQQFTILQASNGKEAMDCMKEKSGNIAIILLDMVMPEMSGIDFLKWISQSTYRNVPVIAFTAEERYQLEALENGAWDFIAKPIEMSILKARVNNVLGRYGFLHEKEWNAALETANLELEKANWRMKHLVNSIPGGIAVYRMTDRFETLYFSDGVAELSGYTREEYAQWVREDAFCAVFEPDRARLLTSAVEKLAKGEAIDETYRIYHKDGNPVWVRLNGIPMEQGQEEILIYAVFQSVSPQTKFYQSVLDETHTAVYACDANTYEILYFNQQMAALAGVESTAATGKKCYEYLFHQDVPCTFCRMKQMEKGKMLEREFVYPANHRTYRMRGKLVEWNQITAHVEYIEDITQKKEAEAKNAALLAQLAAVMDNVPGALCLYRLQGNVLEPVIHNQAFYRVLGYSGQNAETVNRSTNFLNVHPDDLAGLQAKIGEGIDRLEAVQHTYRLYHDQKGCYIWLRLNARVVDQEDGTKLIYCTYTDVTEEKESEQIAIATRERSEQQYRRQMQVIDGINDSGLVAKGYCNLTQNKMIYYSGMSNNARGFKTGKTFDSALYSLVDHALFPETGKEILEVFDRQGLIRGFAQGKTEFAVEYQWRLENGATAWVSTVCRTVLEPETNDILCFVYSYDITEQVMEKNIVLRLTETEYDFLAMVDVESHHFSIRNIKLGMEDEVTNGTMNYEQDCKFRLVEAVVPEERARVLEKIALENLIAHLNREGSYFFTFSIQDKGGKRYRKKMQYCYLDDTKRTILFSRTDITEIYRAEQEQLKKINTALTEAKKANAAKTDFLSRISHDIRTPLNVVIGLAGLGSTSESMEEMREYLGEIGASGKYLLSIINDVLDMSKIESKSLVWHPSVVYLPQFIKETTAIVMPAAVSKNIHFEVKQQGISASYLRFDATYLGQVVVNLLSNAIKFTPAGGKIELCLENISRNGNHVKNRMIVRDNGEGIAEAFLPRIFTPFEQENNTNDVTRQGTGLGLAIVKRIVDLMGGTIEVESKKGEGTAFMIEWDFEMASAQGLHPVDTLVSNEMVDLEGKHILLCEDHLLNTQIATKLLEKKGITVTHVENGQLAVERFSQSALDSFDAILMDIRMPVMDGLEASRQIRSLDRGDAKMVPIIAMTANAFASDVQTSLCAGMNAHLSKPIEPRKLYRTLQEQMGNRPNAQ